MEYIRFKRSGGSFHNSKSRSVAYTTKIKNKFYPGWSKAAASINQLFDAIDQSLLEELEMPAIYEQFFVEKILTAFLCLHFHSKEDIQDYIDELYELDLIPGKEEKRGKALADLTAEHYRTISKSIVSNIKTPSNITDEETFNFLVGQFFFSKNPTPYNPQAPLLNNQAAMAYNRTSNQILTDIPAFADCVETFLRLLISLLIYDENTNEFDVNLLNETPFYESFKEFFAIQDSNEKASDGSIQMRSAWNKVVGDLNALASMSSSLPSSSQVEIFFSKRIACH